VSALPAFGGTLGGPPADAAIAAGAPPPPPRLRIGVFTRVDADVPRRGGLAAPGVVIAVARGWDVFGGALLGGHRGLEVGARAAIGGARIRPYVAAAVPLFFVDGERVAGRGALGVLVEPHRRARVTLEVGGVYALSAPDEVAAAALLASVGAEVWLW
jgi:hypothetical protein